MILVCGGLADGVTELVCSRLQDCCYPYRLLDLETTIESILHANPFVHWWHGGLAV